MAGRSDVPNDRQHVGCKLRCLRRTGHPHAFHGPGRIGRAQLLSPRLGGRLGALRDRLGLVFGSGRQDVDGQFVDVWVIYRHELDVPGCHRVDLASAGWQQRSARRCATTAFTISDHGPRKSTTS
jgi:hypothetical protein